MAGRRAAPPPRHNFHRLGGRMTTLSLEAVHVGTRLRDATLKIDPGSVCVVIGENGAGKSTLLDVIAGVLAPTRGTVQLAGTALSVLRPSERAQKIASIGANDPG